MTEPMNPGIGLLDNSVRRIESRIDNDVDLGRLRDEVADDIRAIVTLQRHK